MTTATENTQQQWQTLKADNPSIRNYDVAEKLGISELELLLSKLGQGVTLLNDKCGEQLKAVENLGEVMALTRNHTMLHASTGTYKSLSIHKTMGLAFGEIDLRIFLTQFKFSLAVDAGISSRKTASLQFFNAQGVAVHKVFLTADNNIEAYNKLVADFTAEQQSQIDNIEPTDTKSLLDSAEKVGLDLALFEQHWSELKDVHHFMALLKKHKIERVPAYRAIKNEFALELNPNAFKQALELAQERGLSIMVFVGSPGVVQIYTGKVNSIKNSEPYFCIDGKKFALHAKLDEIDSVWRIRKPTKDGIVTSLEVFNNQGEQLLLLFGERQEGQIEQEKWQQLLEDVSQPCTV